MCRIVWLYGLVRGSPVVVFGGLLLRERRWLHGQAGTFAQLGALVAVPIGIDAATRLARRQVYRCSSASRRRRERHLTVRRRWTIVGPIIVPIVVIWPMRHCRNLRGSAGAHEATDSVLACSNSRADMAPGAVAYLRGPTTIPKRLLEVSQARAPTAIASNRDAGRPSNVTA